MIFLGCFFSSVCPLFRPTLVTLPLPEWRATNLSWDR